LWFIGLYSLFQRRKYASVTPTCFAYRDRESCVQVPVFKTLPSVNIDIYSHTHIQGAAEKPDGFQNEITH